MKKFYYHLAVCLCVIGGLVGCSKEDEPGGDHTAGNGKFNRTAFSGKRNGRYSQLFIAKNRRTLELLSRILIDNCCAVCSHHHRLDITPVFA